MLSDVLTSFFSDFKNASVFQTLRAVYGILTEVVAEAESKGIQLEDVLPVMPRRHFGDFVVSVFYVIISLKRDFHWNRLKRSVAHLWRIWR